MAAVRGREKQRVYVGLGSNLGDKKKKIREAGRRIAAIEQVTIRRASSLYLTEPVGTDSHPWYYNAVVEADTRLSPHRLLEELQRIEIEMGRKYKGESKPRPIDLDILLYGDRLLQMRDLIVPHPRLLERRFVLQPLVEIAHNLMHPREGGAMDTWLAKLDSDWIVLRKGAFL
jgi:2-amino-4-hydroxy-6-hydroxymethyldihydropteridine diphosphokinase